MELVIFLGIMAVGLAYFGFVFYKELKSGAFNGNSASADTVLGGNLLSKRLAEMPVILPTDASKPVQAQGGGILGERTAKLEQQLEEKTRYAAQLEQDLSAERTHRGEFDSLKEILQRQIEDLKVQNKALKEDHAKLLQENSNVQMKTVTAPVAVSVPVPAAPTATFDNPFSDIKPVEPRVSLFDVFQKEKDKPV